VRIRRRRSEEPAVLPSLDRLSGLIERVVELVDAVGDAKEAPAPDPVVAAPQAEPAPAAEPEAEQERGWVAFVSSAHGYRLVDGPGRVPTLGDSVDLDGTAYRVVKVGPSPLPGDARRCAYVEGALAGEEPREADRTSDA
jgi:hypothetical protein